MNWQIDERDIDNSQKEVYNLLANQNYIVKSYCNEYIALAFWKIHLFQNLDTQSTILIIYHSHYLEYIFTRTCYLHLGLNEKQLTCIQQDVFYSLNTTQKYDYVLMFEMEEFKEIEIQKTLSFYRKSISFWGNHYQVINQGEHYIERIANLLKLQIFELFNCYKLPIGIADFIKALDTNYDIIDRCKNNRKSKPLIIKFNCWQEELNWISDTINKNFINDALILVPHFISFGKLNSVKNIASFFRENKIPVLNSLSRLEYASTLPKLMTFAQSKFCQSEYIFIPFANDLRNIKEFWLALSQANLNVILTYSGKLPDFIKQIPTEYYEHN